MKIECLRKTARSGVVFAAVLTLMCGCSVLRFVGVPVPPEKTPLPADMEAELEGRVLYPDLADVPPVPEPVTTPEENQDIIEDLARQGEAARRGRGDAPAGEPRSGAALPSYFKPKSPQPAPSAEETNLDRYAK